MKQVLAVLVILFTLQTQARGNRVGNGGDVVQCQKQSRILDFYESTLEPKDFKNLKSYKEIVLKVIENLSRFNPALAKQYKKRLDEMEKEIEFRSEIVLTNVKDSNHVFKAKNCQILQIAIRRHQDSAETKRFIIDEDLWKNLDETNKAGLIMHEIIYEHFFKIGEEDSQKTRILNASLFSKKTFEQGIDEFWTLIQSLKVPIYR